MGRNGDLTATTAILLLFIQQVAVGAGIKVTKLDVPPHPRRDTNQTLTCNYDMGTNKLYSVKWYFNEVEFFRYMPGEQPKMQSFPNSNIEVIVEESDPEKVVLKEVGLSASGMYKCEVNTDWPTFLQDEAFDNMTVVVMPNDTPIIEGDVSSHYAAGDTVNLNCTASPSIPSASLAWIVNDNPAPKNYLRDYPHEKVEEGLFVSKLGLSFKLTHQDFIDGELKLKCTSTIATLYHKEVEHSQVTPTDPGVVRQLPSEESLVTANGPGSGAQTLCRGFLERLLALHGLLLLSVHLLR